MRSAFAALLVVATPLAAQSAVDSAGVRAAVAGLTGERVAHIRMVADTAWVAVFDPRKPIDFPGSDSTTAGTAVRVHEVRVERRRGLWVRVQEKPRLRS